LGFLSDAANQFLTKIFFIGIRNDATVKKDTKYSGPRAMEALANEIRRYDSNLTASQQQITMFSPQLSLNLKSAYKFQVQDLTIDSLMKNRILKSE
jgi:hypothetical protein